MPSLTTGITSLADAEARLQMWLDAEQQLAQGAQAYSIGDRTLTRVDSAEVTKRIAYYQRQVNAFRAKAAGARNPSIQVAKWNG